jgi:NAD(P)H-dependent flavin oxidoreductase YrpB (nitropropane dioxygenase family)
MRNGISMVGAQFGETKRTLVVSGRPLRMLPNDYIKEWEARPADIVGTTPLDVSAAISAGRASHSLI